MDAPQRLTVKVIPRASRNEVADFREGVLRVRLTAPPVEGAANDALVRLLAEHCALRRSQIRILRGGNSRLKLVEIQSHGA